MADHVNKQVNDLRVMTWNVNGYADTIHLQVIEIIKHVDVLFLTETKRKQEHMDAQVYPSEFRAFHNSHDPGRYHGVTMIIRETLKPISYPVITSIPPRTDNKTEDAGKGRILLSTIVWNKMQIVILGTYSPNSGCRKLLNLPYRINHWDPMIFRVNNEVRNFGYSVIWLGDLNVAPMKHDVSSPSQMARWAGYTIEERNSFNEFMKGDWTDVYRHVNPSCIATPGYTWIGNDGYRPEYGMRIDAIISSNTLIPYIKYSSIHGNILMSDHIPVSAVFSANK